MSWNRIRLMRDRTLGKPRAITGVAALVIMIVLAYAWIDGGEEPLRPIAQPVEVPERAR